MSPLYVAVLPSNSPNMKRLLVNCWNLANFSLLCLVFPGSRRVRREWWKWSRPQQPGPLCETCTLRSLTPNPRWRKMWRDTVPRTVPLHHTDTRKRFFLSLCLFIHKPCIVVTVFITLWNQTLSLSFFSCHVARTKVPASPAAGPPPLAAPDAVWREHLSRAATSILERLGDGADSRCRRPFQLLHATTLAHHTWRSPQTTLLQAWSQTPW